MKEIVWGGLSTLSDIRVGIEKKRRKEKAIYLMQSMENYNGCCIGSDIRCLTNIHENSIIQTELYSPPLCPAVRKKQGMCAKSPDVYLSCTIRGTKDSDFVHFYSFSFFQISNSVLWIFCTLFGFDDNTSTFMYCLSPLICLIFPNFPLKKKKEKESDSR